MDHADVTNRLSFKELAPWMLVALLIALAPYLYGWLSAPPGMTFSGALVNQDDLSTYLSAIRQGENGRFLFHFTFSPEPWEPRFMLFPYLLLGHASRWVGGSALQWFHLARLAALGFTLVCLLLWVRLMLPRSRAMQRTGWMFIIFGGGLGWLLYPPMARIPEVLRYFPDLAFPELTFLLISNNAPHYVGGLGLLVLLFICLQRIGQPHAPWHWAGLGTIVTMLLAITYVYHIFVIALVVILYSLRLSYQQRRLPWRTLFMLGIPFLPLLPLVYYYFVVATRDSQWAVYANQTHVIAPPLPLGLLLGLGLLALLAFIGLRNWLRDGQETLVIIWLISNLLALYVPVVLYRGRFALGLIVPIATLAAYGWETAVLPWLIQKFPTLHPASLRRMIIWLVIPSTLLTWLFFWQTLSLNKGFPNYLPTADVAAAQWLAVNTDPAQDLILAYYPLGNLLPTMGDTAVFLGQFFWTPDFDGKRAQIEQFWDVSTSNAWRKAFLDEWGITYIVQGSFEQGLSSGAIQPPGRLVYDKSGVRIYEYPQ
jgi:hypothetical protein